MNSDHCLVEREGHVLVITLNRPERKNALSGGMLAGMYRGWRMLDEDPELRVGILTGRGDVFCAGADLKAMGGDERDEEFQQLMAEVPDIHFQALLRHNRPMKPIIAAVEGFAVAGGTEILQGTDIRVAAEDAVFGVTEAKRGLFPMGGSSVRLRRQIPYTLAAEILLTARHVTAQEALDFGLVGRLVPSGQALAEAKKIAEVICDNGPVAIRALMHALREIDESYSEPDALAKEIEIGGPVFASKDAREGPRAFREKRKPVFTGE
ncbi:MAG: crotonase/enoyl-CoA hydratase family protein [Deltaproteobacteria bacterium]|nr:crotonase/enoyl-CoA hydratase family protein [Deltaproteobacteria bacterium]MBW2361225.1 crotonase/enoyl-CoA hydratase family protein [Deltaproteobacteria bacterium]